MLYPQRHESCLPTMKLCFSLPPFFQSFYVYFFSSPLSYPLPSLLYSLEGSYCVYLTRNERGFTSSNYITYMALTHFFLM